MWADESPDGTEPLLHGSEQQNLANIFKNFITIIWDWNQTRLHLLESLGVFKFKYLFAQNCFLLLLCIKLTLLSSLPCLRCPFLFSSCFVSSTHLFLCFFVFSSVFHCLLRPSLHNTVPEWNQSFLLQFNHLCTRQHLFYLKSKMSESGQVRYKGCSSCG